MSISTKPAALSVEEWVAELESRLNAVDSICDAVDEHRLEPKTAIDRIAWAIEGDIE